jgi:hypothetical protein
MFQQLGGSLIAGDGRRGGHHRLAELRIVEPLQVEGQSGLRAVQRARAAHRDALKIGKPAAGECRLEGLVGGKIHSPEIIVREPFGVGPSFVGIKRVIAVIHVLGSRDQSIVGRQIHA